MMPLGEAFYRRRVNAIQAQLPDDSHAGIGASLGAYHVKRGATFVVGACPEPFPGVAFALRSQP